MNNKLLVLSIYVIGLIGCATAIPVVKIPNGNMKITTYSSEKEFAVDKAYKIANKACGNSGKMATIMHEEIRYHGIVDEQVQKIVKTAKDAVWNAGQYAASQVMDGLSQPDDYEVKIEFKCEQ